MNPLLARRGLIGAGLCLPLLTLPGCVAGFFPDYEEAVRRLLTLSTQRAFERLLEENGFFEHEVARVTLPPELGGGGATSLLAELLRDEAVQERLLLQVNQAAGSAAGVAAPVLLESIRNMRVANAVSIIGGGSTAATDYLQERMGGAIMEAMLPKVGEALRLFDGEIISKALGAATDFEFPRLQYDVALKAAQGIYRAIAQEEVAIREDPEATGDSLLSAVLGPLGPT